MLVRNTPIGLLACSLIVTLAGRSALAVDEWKSGIQWPEVPVIEVGEPAAPPSDATVLLGDGDMSQWEGGENWELRDGFAIARKNGIRTKQHFGDCQLHLEFASPAEVRGSGQGRGNSGVYLMGRYEVQILDSHQNDTYPDGQAGAVYKQQPPMVNASRPPGQWQTLDIVFNTPRFDTDGQVAQPAFVTVLHNGVLIQNHFQIQGTTAWHKPPAYERHDEKGPLHLQFHGNPVQFRNIWIRELKPIVGQQPDEVPAEPQDAPADQP